MKRFLSVFIFLGIFSIEAGTAYFALQQSLGKKSNFDFFITALAQSRLKVLGATSDQVLSRTSVEPGMVFSPSTQALQFLQGDMTLSKIEFYPDSVISLYCPTSLCIMQTSSQNSAINNGLQIMTPPAQSVSLLDLSKLSHQEQP